MLRIIPRFACLALFATVLMTAAAHSAEKFIVLQSTTSTQNSGLFNHILPVFQVQTGIEVRVVAVGTGQAIHNAGNCDGDVLITHAKTAEEAFVASGGAVRRDELMYNDFVIVGPKSDPAAVSGLRDASTALSKIAAAGAPFASRGDESGTHKAELRLWKETGVDIAAASGTWYRETGSGMGATLNLASGMNAYALTDRATWLAFGNKGELVVQVEKDPLLFNQYGVMLVNPEQCPDVKALEAQRFVDWLLAPEGQAMIASYRRGGRQLFFPNAKNKDAVTD